MPSVVAPIKEGYLFTGWDKEIQPVTQETEYTAQYVQITNAKLVKLPKQQYEFEEQLDVSGGVLELNLAEGENQQIPLNSSMVSGFDNEKAVNKSFMSLIRGHL